MQHSRGSHEMMMDVLCNSHCVIFVSDCWTGFSIGQCQFSVHTQLMLPCPLLLPDYKTQINIIQHTVISQTLELSTSEPSLKLIMTTCSVCQDQASTLRWFLLWWWYKVWWIDIVDIMGPPQSAHHAECFSEGQWFLIVNTNASMEHLHV